MVLAISGRVMPNARNSFALAENFLYNIGVFPTGMTMRTVISALVRIGRKPVRHFETFTSKGWKFQGLIER
jgi:hypothetical protein